MEPEKYNCLVVDDEPIARRIIVNYIQQLPMLSVVAEQINAFDTIAYLRTNNNTDIIFLDINMPNLSGLQLLKIVQPLQPVIFTTAYPEYAIESYDLNAVDYLLKPFSFERFTQAAYKAINAVGTRKKNSTQQVAASQPTFFIKSDGKNYPVLIEDILYCEAMKNYTVVNLKQGKKLTPLIPISKFESILKEAGGDFIQVHRSFIISRKHVGAVTPTFVAIRSFEIPIGIQYKERLFKELGIVK